MRGRTLAAVPPTAHAATAGQSAAAIDVLPPVSTSLKVALALFITVAVSKLNVLVPGISVIQPAKLLAAAVAVTAFMTPVGGRLAIAFRERPARAVALIGMLMVLSVPLSLWPGHSLGYFRDQGTQTCFLFVFAAAAFTDRRAIPALVFAWVASVSIEGLRMLAPGGMTEVGRAMLSPAFDPNESAALLVCTLPFALWMAARSGFGRLVGIGSAVVLILGIVRTGSRGGLFGLAAMGVLMIIVSPPRRRVQYLVAAVVGSALVLGTASEDLRTRMQSVFSRDASQEDYNFTDRDGRVEIWKRGIGYMISHPILGVGVDAFETAEGMISGKQNEGFGVRNSAAHNSFVQIGAELGVFGLAAFVLAIGASAAHLWRLRRRAVRGRTFVPDLADAEMALCAAALASLVGIVTTGFFLSFGYHPVMLFVIAVCVGVTAGSPFARADGIALAGARGAWPGAAVPPARGGAARRGWRSVASSVRRDRAS